MRSACMVASPTPNVLRGIGLMMLAASSFACIDATAKYLSAHYAVPGIVWVRYVIQVALCFAYFFPIFTNQLIPYEDWSARMWLGSRWI